jgi:putative transposase
VNPRHKELSVRAQTELLEIPRSTLYYKPIGESPENLEIMQKMDKHHIEHPTCGVLGMQDMLRLNGFQINHKRIRRLMRLMNIRVKYPQKSLSEPGARKYILPYLLRGLDIVKTNQVWSIDISYIPMKQGFMYLTAIMDVRSRYIVGWSLSNTLEKSVCLDLVEESIRKYGAPEIINSDQGVQFTNPAWIWLKSRSENMVHPKSSTPTRVFSSPIRPGSKRLKKKALKSAWMEKDEPRIISGLNDFGVRSNRNTCI